MATTTITVHHSHLDVSNSPKTAPSDMSQAIKTTIAAAGGGGSRLDMSRALWYVFFCYIFFYYTNVISYDYDYQQLHLIKSGTSTHPQHKKKTQMTVHTVVWALTCLSRMPCHNGHKPPSSVTNGGLRQVLSPHVCEGISRYWGDEGRGSRCVRVLSPQSVY